MLEKHFENVLQRYPELIEEGLKFSGRQVSVGGKYVDLLFEDRFGQKLIIELKKGIIKREHVAQLLDYEGYFLTADNPNIRVMLIGNRVPPNLRNSLDHHGFEWKEIPVSELITYLKNKNDDELLSQFNEEETLTVHYLAPTPIKDKSISKMAQTPASSMEQDEFVNKWINAYPKADLKFFSKHIGFCSELRKRILSLGNNIVEKFGDKQFAFLDGEKWFFGIHPQSSKVTLAPLTLRTTDINELSLTESIRDISEKKYLLGGQVRVDIYDTNNANKIDVAFELAKRSFCSDQSIETWHSRKRLKS